MAALHQNVHRQVGLFGVCFHGTGLPPPGSRRQIFPAQTQGWCFMIDILYSLLNTPNTRLPAKNVFPQGSLWRMLVRCGLSFKSPNFWLIVPCLASETFLQVLVLADLHNTTQLKLHVLKFINDRRVAEVRVDSPFIAFKKM